MASSSAARLTPAITRDLLKTIDYVLLDVDGVLWAGDAIFSGVSETIDWLKNECGIKVRYMTNNATLSREDAAAKFRKNGIRSVTSDEIYTSAFAAASLLSSPQANSLLDSSTAKPLVSAAGKFDRDIFVIGNPGLHKELRAALAPGRTTYGLELNEKKYVAGEVSRAYSEATLPAPGLIGPEKPEKKVSLKNFDFGAVVVGLDFGHNMAKLAVASMLLQQHERVRGGADRVAFVATNTDPQIPMGRDGWLLPGAGSIISSLTTVSSRKPDVICGKPSSTLLEVFMAREGVTDAKRCLMIGDRLTTDIAFGNGVGTQTLFVLSGAETLRDLEEAQRSPDTEYRRRHTPTFVGSGLVDLMNLGRGAPTESKL